MGPLSGTRFVFVPFNDLTASFCNERLTVEERVVEEQIERWPLRSGTWYRDLRTDSWRLATTRDGTVASAKLPTEDLGRLVGAMRDSSTGQWFPSDFAYSPRTGTALHVPISCLDSPWVPPFGASALADIGTPAARGLRQTPAPLNLARFDGRLDPASDADRTLPALPAGQYRFLVHKLDVAESTLMAIEPEHGSLFVLLPESRTWTPLECPAGGALAGAPKNSRGWRMEVVGARRASLYLPTANGLAAVRPTLIGLSYAAEYFGQGPALGGPVAWAGEVWLPVLGGKGDVNLVGKPPGTDPPIVLPTSAAASRSGFEAPVFDPMHVIWPNEKGQLILRLDEDGQKEADWIAWPDGLRPAFSLGCPYLSLAGTFWQPCWRGRQNGPLEYVQMGQPKPERVAVDAPRLGTGHISYRNAQRIQGDPWKEPKRLSSGASSEVVLPLIESELERAVVGLRIDAPQGVLALLESSQEEHRAVLQLQAEGRPEVRFGTLSVTRPWLTSLFVYDAHLWVYHPELPQALGWKLVF
jgi:hypothetical protein